ncbi:MAG: AzlC family ABC transporter permease [Pseudorhodoplanes sp.]|nr:AzlC family ABC transporter permease [Pseudorhodoplanes sp.]
MNSVHSESTTGAGTPYWSVAGLSLGMRYALPLLPGSAVFGAAFGTVAAQKGLSLTEAALMSAFVFAGASQLVAMEIWQAPLTLATIVTLALVTGVVNMRMLLMGASLRPWLGPLPASQVYPVLLMNTDASWLIAIRHRTEGGSDAAVLLGASIALWLVWVPVTMVGYVAGALIADPRRFGIDLILPMFFVAMLVPLWRGPRQAVPWAVAGAVALLVQALVPGYWFMIAGSLSGAVAGGFVDERK